MKIRIPRSVFACLIREDREIASGKRIQRRLISFKMSKTTLHDLHQYYCGLVCFRETARNILRWPNFINQDIFCLHTYKTDKTKSFCIILVAEDKAYSLGYMKKSKEN